MKGPNVGAAVGIISEGAQHLGVYVYLSPLTAI